MTDEEKLKEYERFHEWLGRRLQSTRDSYNFAGFTNDVMKEHRELWRKFRKPGESYAPMERDTDYHDD